MALAVMMFATGAAGAVAVDATAEHFHVNCNPHGFVHGENTNDGSFFSRVDTEACHHTKRCDLFQFNSVIVYGGSAPDFTCNVWSRNYGNYQECPGNARVELSRVFGYHQHLAHNWCG